MIFNAGVSFDKLVGTQSGRFIVKTMQDYNRVSALCAASIVVSLALKTEASPYVWEVAEGATVTENSSVTDATLGTSDGIRKTGEGNLRLANAGNTFGGGVRVEAGMLQLGAGITTAVGNPSQAGIGEITLAGGGIESYQSWILYLSDRSVQVDSDSFLGNRLNLRACLSGSGKLTKVGTGASTLEGPHTNFTGNIVVAEGSLAASSGSTAVKPIPLGLGEVSVLNGAALVCGGGTPTTISNNITVAGHGINGTGSLITGNRTATLYGTVTLTGDVTFSDTSLGLAFNNVVQDGDGNFGIRFIGTIGQKITLGVANAFGGDVVLERGKLVVGHDDSLGSNLAGKTVVVNAADDGDNAATNLTTELSLGYTGCTVGTLVLNLLNASGDYARITRSGSSDADVIRANVIHLRSGRFQATSGTSAYGWATTGSKTLVVDGGTLDPGGALNVGTFVSENVELGTNGVLELDVLNVAGTAGANWDLWDASGTATVTATPERPFVIKPVSLASPGTPGALPGWSGHPAKWQILKADSVLDFDPDAFVIDLSQFEDFNTLGSSFEVMADADGIYLVGPSGTTIIIR